MQFHRKQHLIPFLLAVAAALLLGECRSDSYTESPRIAQFPFLCLWSTPYKNCEKYDVSLEFSQFQEVTTPVATANDQAVTIFYTTRFGIYPHIDKHSTVHHGGLPQLVNMTAHELLAEKNIMGFMPTQRDGLGVLDFEEWRPLWARNWAPKDIYRQKSIDLVNATLRKSKNFTVDAGTISKDAKLQFEKSARDWFLRSLRLAKKMQPRQLWGYYLFPDCYNTNLNKDYTGKCPDIEKERNKELGWLWKESTALFPSIYLPLTMANFSRAYIRHRMQEAMEMSLQAAPPFSTPVYPYIRPVYKHNTDTYLPEVGGPLLT